MEDSRSRPSMLPVGPEVRTGPASRHMYLDNLKVVLIAAIIAMHAIAGYAGAMEVWTYAGVRETTLAPAVELAIVVLALPSACS